ncbi:sensor histidine kinase [Methylobacterium sp. Leaf118]|uniref:sensor histidine kinase n=1 Tax=Methylobacterium sp. Leaf118 TaxID=2876562 RepID=UPI001E4333EE|nr:ATP-binding protein [Methylobacterium sp. Leaf118]
MSDRAVQGLIPEDQELVRAAVERWRIDPMTAHLVREGAALLVLDDEARRLLHAAGPAAAFGAGITSPDGTLLPSLRLPDQIRRTGMIGGRPRMVRLRMDPRGVAPPVVALLARVSLDAERGALLIAPLGSLPALRPTEPAVAPAPTDEADADASTSAASPAPSLLSASAEAEAEPADLPIRLVWRSDADGVVTQVSRTHPDLAQALLGRSWAMLTADGIVEGDALAAALTARETFRALPVVVQGRTLAHALDISGAPSGRVTRDFSGFSGFAIVKERQPRPALGEDAPAGTDGDALESFEDTPDVRHEDSPAASTVAEAEALSVSEHAAFREVARVLGLRFAHDESSAATDAPRSDPAPGGSVTPFPTPPGRVAETEARVRGTLLEILESLPVGVLVYRESEVLFASRAFLALTGYGDAAALAATGLPRLFRGLSPGERGITPGRTLPFARAGGDTVALVVDHARLDWDGAPAEICLVRASDPETIPPPLPPNAARLRAEKVLDSLEEGVVTLDGEGRVVGLNPSAAELVHAHPKEIVGGRFADLFAPESLPALEAAVSDSQRSGASELLGITARSGAAALRLRIARLFGEDSPGYCASLREIREEVAAVLPVAAPAAPAPAPEDASAAAAPWKANALARVSREIRTPLNAILSLTDMMLSDRFDRADAERLEAYLREVRLSGGRIAGLIDDLRDLAEIQAGRSALTFTRIALNDLVSECIGTMQAQAARDRIVVRTSLAPDLPVLQADERSIRQATLTVIGNAIRVTEAGGQVIVSTTLAERDEVALRVRDTGPGMSPEEVSNALEPFREGAGSTAECGGFGLTLTKALVEANRGRFRISSRPDEGTLVEMIFPAP